MVHKDRDEQSSDGTNSIRQSHQDAGISGSDIKMIDIESGNSKSTASHTNSQSGGGNKAISTCGCTRHYQKEKCLHPETSTVEELPNISSCHDSTLTKVIRQQTTKRYDDRHQ